MRCGFWMICRGEHMSNRLRSNGHLGVSGGRVTPGTCWRRSIVMSRPAPPLHLSPFSHASSDAVPTSSFPILSSTRKLIPRCAVQMVCARTPLSAARRQCGERFQASGAHRARQLFALGAHPPPSWRCEAPSLPPPPSSHAAAHHCSPAQREGAL